MLMEISNGKKVLNLTTKAFLYQFVNAGYANLNFKPNKSWDILAGIRAENNITITRYKLITDNINGSFRNITKNQNYFLPSFLKKALNNNKSNLRLAISKTITRPILIETMPIEYINQTTIPFWGTIIFEYKFWQRFQRSRQ